MCCDRKQNFTVCDLTENLHNLFQENRIQPSTQEATAGEYGLEGVLKQAPNAEMQGRLVV